MVDPAHPHLSIVRQCGLVSISRSAFYYSPSGETPLNLTLMRLIDEQFLETPFYGARQLARHLRRRGYAFETGSELRAGLARWIGYYNADRPHSGLGGRTLDEAYHRIEPTPLPGLAPATASSRLAA